MFSKTTKNTLITLAVFAINFTMVLNANAQYSQIYAEISYGQQELESFGFILNFSDFEDNKDNGDLGSYAIGRRFNDNVAAELSYVKFGSFESEITGFSPIEEFDDNNVLISSTPRVPDFAEFEMSAVQISVIGSIAWGRRLNFFVKGGLSQANISAKVINNNFGFTARGSESGTGLHFGAGVVVNITRSFAIEIEYQVFDISNTLLFENLDVQTTTLGLRYNF